MAPKLKLENLACCASTDPQFSSSLQHCQPLTHYASRITGRQSRPAGSLLSCSHDPDRRRNSKAAYCGRLRAGLVALMTLVEARSVPLSSAGLVGLVKMEERKRPASYDHDDSAPPLKRQVTSVNGGGKGHPDDMPWKDELEVRHTPPSLCTLQLASSYPFRFVCCGGWG